MRRLLPWLLVVAHARPAPSTLHASQRHGALRARVAQFNEKFIAPGAPPVQIGVGVHSGELMLGVVGEAERMETTVISDAVNVASRLERLTRRYRGGLVVSEHVMGKLTTRDQYQFRALDKVQIKDRSEPLVIYEIFAGDPEALVERKLATQADYEEALRLYYDRKFTRPTSSSPRLWPATPKTRSSISTRRASPRPTATCCAGASTACSPSRGRSATTSTSRRPARRPRGSS